MFSEINPNIQGVNQGNVMWGDYDNDSDLDVFVFGGDGDFGYNTGLYRNDNGSFVEVFPGTFIDLVIGDSEWGDFDNDGDLDIIISGSIDASPAGGVTKIYMNVGSSFVEVYENQINGFIGSAVALGDYDNDGDLDVAIGGEEATDGSNNPRNIEIYKNTGTGFQMVYQETNTGITNGSLNWGDYNKDGDLDLLVTGMTYGNSTYRTSTIIDNTSEGFVKNTKIDLVGVGNGSGEWGDYDNDGDLDILLSGSTYENNTLSRMTLIYENNDNDFNVVFENTFIGTEEGEAIWGDYDNDGDLDILIVGRPSTEFSDYIARIYENRGSDFTMLENFTTGVRIGSVAWGDYDNDGDLDILLGGQDDESNTITRIYRNNAGSNIFSTNTPPSAPQNLQEVLYSGKAMLSWGNSTDNETAQKGLNYNLHLRTENDTIITSQSKANGFRKIVERGNIGYLDSVNINLEPGDYYWKIQAIDKSFQGSVFSAERMFHINFPPIIVKTNTSFSMAEEDSLFVDVNDFVIEDPDNSFPDDFALTVLGGEFYTVSNTLIIPDVDFNGTILASVLVNDGIDTSNTFNILIHVSEVNDAPVITGTSDSLTTMEDTPLLLTIDDLLIEDPDNSFPDDFALTILVGEFYTVSNTLIIPDVDFNGTILAPVLVNDGIDTSNTFNILIHVSEVNDAPVITGTSDALTTPEETPLLLTINDLLVEDPDNSFPDDFTLTVLEGENYSVTNNEITPEINFNGILSIPVQVNDGIDTSEQYIISVEVTQIISVPANQFIDNLSIYPNPINDQLNINTNNTIRPFHLQIFSINGKVVYTNSEEIEKGNFIINLSHLKNSIYLLIIANDNITFSTKLIKK
jgi:predicted nucleotidyltransferase